MVEDQGVPVGSQKNAVSHAPLAIVSSSNSTARDSSSLRAASTSSTWRAIPPLLGSKRRPIFAASTTWIVRFPVSTRVGIHVVLSGEDQMSAAIASR